MRDITRREFATLAAAGLLFARARATQVTSWYHPRLATTLASARPTDALVIGPWATDDTSLTHAGDVEFGASATLAGSSANRVRYFMMGGGSGRKDKAGRMQHGGAWRQAREWPMAHAIPTAYYLQRSGALSFTRAPEDFTWDEYKFDPADPVPTVGGPGLGAFDQAHRGRALSRRHDVLVFQTPPLARAVEIAGPVTARLWIGSDCPDTDFTIKLMDVYPPNADYPRGFVMNLTDGALSVRHRVSRDRTVLMVPGGVYEIALSAPPTANRFAHGHRIRLDVSSSNAPRVAVNANTGGAAGTSPRIATNRVYLDRARPSHVMLPLLPLPG